MIGEHDFGSSFELAEHWLKAAQQAFAEGRLADMRAAFYMLGLVVDDLKHMQQPQRADATAPA